MGHSYEFERGGIHLDDQYNRLLTRFRKFIKEKTF